MQDLDLTAVNPPSETDTKMDLPVNFYSNCNSVHCTGLYYVTAVALVQPYVSSTCHARWITKATNTHSEYKTLITSPQQQVLHEYDTKLSNTNFRFLVDLS